MRQSASGPAVGEEQQAPVGPCSQSEALPDALRNRDPPRGMRGRAVSGGLLSPLERDTLLDAQPVVLYRLQDGRRDWSKFPRMFSSVPGGRVSKEIGCGLKGTHALPWGTRCQEKRTDSRRRDLSGSRRRPCGGLGVLVAGRLLLLPGHLRLNGLVVGPELEYLLAIVLVQCERTDPAVLEGVEAKSPLDDPHRPGVVAERVAV